MSTKPLILTLFFVTAPLLQAETLPKEARALLERRGTAVQQIDRDLHKKLKKVKTTYTKKGDLDAANAVAAVMKGAAANQAPAILDPLVGTKWNFLKSNKGKINEFKFLGDGTVDCEHSYPDAIWRRLENDTILFAYGIHAYIVFHTKEGEPDFMSGHHSLSGAPRFLRRSK